MMFVRPLALFGFCTLLCLAAAPISLAEEPGAKPSASKGEPLLKSGFGTKPGVFDIPGLTGGSDKGDIDLTASFTLTEGTSAGTLQVRADITPGWHTFSMTLPKGATGQASVLKVESAEIANLKNL